MAILYRFKCPKCGEVQDAREAQLCKKCGHMIEMPTDGCIQLYRMGSPIGVAAGMGVYLNGVPYGHIANKQSIRIPLPAGSYKLHVTQGVARRCNDPIVEIEAGSKMLHCYKVHIKPGFWTNSQVIEKAHFSEMPED